MRWVLPCGHVIEIDPRRSFFSLIQTQHHCWECRFGDARGGEKDGDGS